MTDGARVIVFTDATQVGGAEHALHSMIEALDARFGVTVMGVDPTVVARIAPQRPATTRRVVPAVRNKADIGTLRAVRRAIRDADAAIFHANLASQIDCRYGLLAASTVPGLRLVALEHSPIVGGGRVALAAKGLLSRRFAAHAAVGTALAATIERGPLVRRGSVRVLHPGVSAAGPPAPLPFARPIVGSVARFVPGKRLELLVDAVAALPGVSLVLVGDGPEAGALRRAAHERGVGDRVHLTGWLDDPAAAIGSFDVFALPSDVEGLPLSILQAMHAGVPVVTTDVGSVADAVHDGETGLVVTPGRADELASAIGRLLDDAELRVGIAERALHVARTEFSVDAAARRLEAVYDGVGA